MKISRQQRAALSLLAKRPRMTTKNTLHEYAALERRGLALRASGGGNLYFITQNGRSLLAGVGVIEMKKPMSQFECGARAAADLAGQYRTTHQHRLDDCILGKLSIRKAKPRRNKAKLQDPKDAFMHGVAVALAEMHRLAGNDSVVMEAADTIGLTISVAKAAGADRFDWKELKRAGVK